MAAALKKPAAAVGGLKRRSSAASAVVLPANPFEEDEHYGLKGLEEAVDDESAVYQVNWQLFRHGSKRPGQLGKKSEVVGKRKPGRKPYRPLEYFTLFLRDSTCRLSEDGSDVRVHVSGQHAPGVFKRLTAECKKKIQQHTAALNASVFGEA